MIPPPPPMPGFSVEAPSRRVVPAPVVFSEIDLRSGRRRTIAGLAPWGRQRGKAHVAISVWSPDGMVHGRVLVFGDGAGVVAAGIRQARRGLLGVVGHLKGRELAVEVSVRDEGLLAFRCVAAARPVLRQPTLLGPEEIDALDRGLSWLDFEERQLAGEST